MDASVAVLSSGSILFLVIAVGMALAFEFVNGFHDTANAVATVIYTNTLRPWTAVIWSGLWNLLGVLTSSGAVAFGILALLPVELVINTGSNAGFTMVFALLMSAILWNLGTWWMGLPASSSHTLIGSIMGVGMVNSLMAKGAAFGDGVNWGKARDVFMSLLISPVIGFTVAALLLLVMKLAIRRPELFAAPLKDKPPPPWIRGLLILTCTGVSFAHGSNDGQKGMGLIMLILIGIIPGVYALKMDSDVETIKLLADQANKAQAIFVAHASPGVTSAPATAPAAASPATSSAAATTALSTTSTVVSQTEAEIAATLSADEDKLSAFVKASGKFDSATYPALAAVNHQIISGFAGKTELMKLTDAERRSMRKRVYLVGEGIAKLNKKNLLTDATEKDTLLGYKGAIDKLTKFIPLWVKIAVAMALGLGTMIGWKRIVVTVGEKIGKTHLTYAQGASAELVAMTTIGAADILGLPVSTTHVLSSGVAGTMAANGSGLQTKTLISLLLAWVLTMPVCVILGSGIFSAGLYVMLTVMGLAG
jgi:PiT family inorganic phosphate transporter